MENQNLSLVEEGGLTAVVDLETDILELILTNPKLQCPQCEDMLIMNGKCKTCYSCGWSSCDV